VRVVHAGRTCNPFVGSLLAATSCSSDLSREKFVTRVLVTTVAAAQPGRVWTCRAARGRPHHDQLAGTGQSPCWHSHVRHADGQSARSMAIAALHSHRAPRVGVGQTVLNLRRAGWRPGPVFHSIKHNEPTPPTAANCPSVASWPGSNHCGRDTFRTVEPGWALPTRSSQAPQSIRTEEQSCFEAARSCVHSHCAARC
jgi:hypothetical protein